MARGGGEMKEGGREGESVGGGGERGRKGMEREESVLSLSLSAPSCQLHEGGRSEELGTNNWQCMPSHCSQGEVH